MKKNKIVFMGTPKFAATVLKSLIEADYQVDLVVTQPDKIIGRKKTLSYSKVKELALELGLGLFQPVKIKNDFESIKEIKPDLIITAAYGQIIPKELLDIPSFGCINLHASILPKYRGGSPIQTAIKNGETETGISLMYMDEKMDSGDIIDVEKIDIDIKDTSDSLFDKLAVVASRVLLKNLPLIFNGSNGRVSQNHSEATYAYNIKKEDEFINFNRSTLEVYNHIRSLLSNPGAYAIIEGKKIKFHEVYYQIKKQEEASIFLGLNKGFIEISTNDGIILVKQIQPEGKNIMEAKSFFNGIGKGLVGKKFNEQLQN